MLNELWVMIHEYLLKGKPFTCMSQKKKREKRETVNDVVISETCYVRYVFGGYERCNDGGLASGANGPSPAQSRAIAAIEAWPTIGGSCTCFQNLRIMAIIFSFQLMNLKTSSSCSLHGWIISYHNSVETLNTWQFPLKHAAEEVRKREKKNEAKMVGVEALHLVR